jgi:CRP/FNR family transcriptional regulator, anaerobic regulatory protein
LSRCERLYFIEKGLVRAYFYHDGKEITDWFGAENKIIGPIMRHFPVKETQHRVELLEESIVWSVTFRQLEELYQQSHEIERLGRVIAILAVLHLQKKLDSVQLLSAKQRYEQFLQDFPTLIQRVSLSHIASYLGMNQVTLSRIRHGR